jgi:uncharacterized protein (DUF779 family)
MIDETNPAEPRVIATQAALDFIREIQADHPDILFHQSGGCCDGSSPMCYPTAEYRVGETDVKLGEIGGVPVYISGSQYEVWKHTQLIIDVVPGQGVCSRSTTDASDASSRARGCFPAARPAPFRQSRRRPPHRLETGSPAEPALRGTFQSWQSCLRRRGGPVRAGRGRWQNC